MEYFEKKLLNLAEKLSGGTTKKLIRQCDGFDVYASSAKEELEEVRDSDREILEEILEISLDAQKEWDEENIF